MKNQLNGEMIEKFCSNDDLHIFLMLWLNVLPKEHVYPSADEYWAGEMNSGLERGTVDYRDE